MNNDLYIDPVLKDLFMKLIFVGKHKEGKYKLFVVEDIKKVKLDYVSYVCPVCGCFGSIEFVKDLLVDVDENGQIIKKFKNGNFVFRCNTCSFWDIIEDMDTYKYIVGTRWRDQYLEIFINERFYEELKRWDSIDVVVNTTFCFDH